MLVVKRDSALRSLFLRKLAANCETRGASCFVGRGLPRRADLILLVRGRERGVMFAVSRRNGARCMRAGRGRGLAMQFGRRGTLRSISAACNQGRKSNNEDCRPAHEGECGQSRASPVYVDTHTPQSALADADWSDNKTLPDAISCYPSSGIGL